MNMAPHTGIGGFTFARRGERGASVVEYALLLPVFLMITLGMVDTGRAFFRTHGALAVMLTRALPVLMETMSLVAGVSRMPRRAFLWASLAGTAPVALAYAWAGAMSQETGSLLPAAIFLVAITGLGWAVYRARVKTAGSR